MGADGKTVCGMAEYIDREAAIKAVEIADFYKGSDIVPSGYAADAIRAIPAADVRPVVLCRDCEYAYDSVGGWCCSHGICVDCIVREDFFCVDGVKREKS